MRIVGIDPGKKGAIACVDGRDFVCVHDLAEHVKGETVRRYSYPRILRILRRLDPDVIVIEDIRIRPGRSFSTEQKLIGNFEALLAMFQFLDSRVTIHHADPRSWKSSMGLTSDKQKSIDAALAAFPEAADHLSRKMDDGRAEALMLTAYYNKTLAASANEVT